MGKRCGLRRFPEPVLRVQETALADRAGLLQQARLRPQNGLVRMVLLPLGVLARAVLTVPVPDAVGGEGVAAWAEVGASEASWTLDRC